MQLSVSRSRIQAVSLLVGALAVCCALWLMPSMFDQTQCLVGDVVVDDGAGCYSKGGVPTTIGSPSLNLGTALVAFVGLAAVAYGLGGVSSIITD